MRVAVVGGGPKGLFAVERLVARLPDAAPVEIVVFDPQPPGWGAAYRPDQPGWLRLNVSAAIVDAGWRVPGEPTLGLPDFATWRARRGEAEPLEPFPPRALVGAYLAECWSMIAHRSPGGVGLEHRPRRIESLAAEGEAWRIGDELFDEVLLATGHATDWPGVLRRDWRGTPTLVPAVYPTSRLDEATVPPKAVVTCRGAALTFIDAALALTEGRGGRFADGSYRRSGAEPVVLRPVGRRGRFMEVKPQPGVRFGVEDLRERGLRSCRAAAGDVARVLAAVRSTAQSYLERVGGGALADDDFLLPAVADPLAELRRSLRVARGDEVPRTPWALGQAWRDLYPAIVDQLGNGWRDSSGGHRRSDGSDRAERAGGGGRRAATGTTDSPAATSSSAAPTGWDRFAEVARRLEPVAFGPPPVNAAKLVALGEAGLLDSRFLAGDWTGAIAGADVVIDCVLPPPGLVPGQWPATLVEDGILTRAPGRRGVVVAPDASCLDADGRPIPGLSAVGRPTEDVVVGNDTLSRSLHPGIDHWADRVARMALRQGVTA